MGLSPIPFTCVEPTETLSWPTLRYSFFMDSRNSGTAPAGHIQTFDYFSKGGGFLLVPAEGNQSERVMPAIASMPSLCLPRAVPETTHGPPPLSNAGLWATTRPSSVRAPLYRSAGSMPLCPARPQHQSHGLPLSHAGGVTWPYLW